MATAPKSGHIRRQTHDPNVTEDLFGNKVRACATLRLKEWTFLVISGLNLLTVIGLTLERIVYFIQMNKVRTDTDFAFALVLLVNVAFGSYYVISGIMRERSYEICMYVAGLLVVMTYSIANFAGIFHLRDHQPSPNSTNYSSSAYSTIPPLEATTSPIYMSPVGTRTYNVKLARVILCLLLGPPNVISAIFVVRSFGWLEFRAVGASAQMQRMYSERSFYYSTLSFDLQVALSFVILMLNSNKEITTQDIVYCVVGSVFTFAWSCLGWYMVKREVKWLCALFVGLSVLVPAYVAYRVVTVVLQNSVDWSSSFLEISTTVAALLMWIMRGVVLFGLWRVYKHFNHNLSETVFNADAFYECCRCCKRGATEEAAALNNHRQTSITSN